MLRLAWLLLFAAAGCVGEASVSYQGAVVEGTSTSHAFESSPTTDTPVVGATVALCFRTACTEPAQTVKTDTEGHYPEIEAVFGGFVGADTHIEVLVTAPDGRTASYAMIYEDTKDPTTANPDGAAPVYLNFTLAP